jgi:hypothetical protein
MLEPRFSPGGSSMGRFSKVRRPAAAEVQQLHHRIATLPDARQRRRAEILVLYATGLAANAIAKLLGLHLNTVSHVLHLFKERGLAAVTHMSVGGAPRQVSSYQVARIQHLADQPPLSAGCPMGVGR